MTSQKIRNVAQSLETFTSTAGLTSEQTAYLLACCRNLCAAAEQAQALEDNCCPTSSPAAAQEDAPTAPCVG